MNDKEKFMSEIMSHVEKACQLLTDNYNALLAVVSKEFLNEMVVKNMSLYTSHISDTRAKILKAEILDYWRTATPYKIVSQTMILQKFADVWQKLRGGKFHYRIDNILFKIILASTAKIDEYKVIEFCHLDESAGVFGYDGKEIESYINSKFDKDNKVNKVDENNE